MRSAGVDMSWIAVMIVSIIPAVVVPWIIPATVPAVVWSAIPEWVISPAIPAAVVPWVIESAISIPRIPIESAVVSVIWIPRVIPCIIEPWIVSEAVIMIIRRIVWRHVRAVAEIPAVED